MGSGAASSKAKELYDAGYNGWQVGLGAFASGAIEWLTEKYSVEYFTSHILNGDIGTLRQLAMNVAVRILSQYGSSRSKTETAKRLQQIADYIVGEAEPDYKHLQALVRDAAEYILEGSAVDVNMDQQEMLRDVLFTLGAMKIRVDDKQKAETGDWKSFRQKNRDRIRFTEDGGTSMDTVWLELQDTYGKGMFPDDVMNHGDQLLYLDDLLDSLSHDFQNPYQGVWGQTIEQMSIDIIDQLMSSEVRQAGKTRADRIADRARAQAEEAIRDMVDEDFSVYINDRAEAIAGKEIARLRNRQEKQLRNQRNKLEKLEDNCKQIPQSAKTRSIRAKRRNNGKYEKRLSAKCRKPNCKTGNLQRETEESRIYISSRLLH